MHTEDRPRVAGCSRLMAVLLRLLLLATLAPGHALSQEALKLRVVGGLGALNQYTRNEVPFWTTQLKQLSGGKYSAEIVPFDRAGIRGQELLSMVRLGTVTFGTLLLSQAAPKDAELAAPDLAGLNPDAASLRRTVAAYRPRLEALLRERHGAELLAVYAYPAQVLFCSKPLSGLADLRGRTVRTSSATQADWVESLGAKAVQIPFANVVTNVRAGNVDCAITGTMSGNTIGLHQVTSHIHTTAVTWGLSVFVAHGATWRALPEDLRALLKRELPRLERDIWTESERETEDGVACNTGERSCLGGTAGRMTAVRPGAADEMLRRDMLKTTVLPRWLQRCGPSCAASWNRFLAPVVGVDARPM
jgi:TRAP-type C4-dicarboxylate transport system substrate-binding protein